MHKIVTNNSPVGITVFQYGLRSLMLVMQETVIYKGLVDRLFNMDVVIFRWIMTSKIVTEIVATRCVSNAQNVPKMRLRPGLHPGHRWGAYSTPLYLLAGVGGPLCGGKGRRVEGRGSGEEGWEGRGGKSMGGDPETAYSR